MDSRLTPYEEKMQKSYENLVEEYATIRAGRANPHILDRITVDYYGTPTPLQQVGNISVPEARILQIQPWESSLIKEIEKFRSQYPVDKEYESRIPVPTQFYYGSDVWEQAITIGGNQKCKACFSAWCRKRRAFDERVCYALNAFRKGVSLDMG